MSEGALCPFRSIVIQVYLSYQIQLLLILNRPAFS